LIEYPEFEYKNTKLNPPTRNGLRIIKSLIRGSGTSGDKIPLLKQFKLLWNNILGKEEYKKTIRKLQTDNWVSIERYQGKGQKRGKKVIGLTDREYAIKYLEHCAKNGFQEAYIEHHGQPDKVFSKFRNR